jgi:hypothetical protein
MPRRIDGRVRPSSDRCEMHRLTAAFSAALLALAGAAGAQEPPPRYGVSCASCPIAAPYLPNTLEAFADHTRKTGDARLAEELLAAQTRAERIAGGGVVAGLAAAAAGWLLLPQRCPDLAVVQEPICEIGRPQIAVMTAGATLAVMGTLYFAIAQPRAEELVARVNVWNRAHPDAPWLLAPRGAPSGDRLMAPDTQGERILDERETRIIASRRPGSRWLEPSVYVPIMIGASCAAAGAWFLAEALQYQRAIDEPTYDPRPLAGRVQPPPVDPVPGLTAAACTALSFGAAVFIRFNFNGAPQPRDVQLQIGPGAVGVGGSFD